LEERVSPSANALLACALRGEGGYHSFVEERLQKILARAGIASRRAAERLMREGRVTLNGEAAREPGSRGDVLRDDIRVDGVRVRPAGKKAYFALNKPRGVVTTRSDPGGRRTVMDLAPGVSGLFPVGRLDVMTEGLILLTNDGEFALHVAHPRFEVPRTYHAKVRGAPTAASLERLTRGIRIEGRRLSVDRCRVLRAERNAWIEIVLHEGRNREVRRLLEAVGHPVSKLRRVGIGDVTIHGLATGACRKLTDTEVRSLMKPKRFDEPKASRAAGRPAESRTADSDRRSRSRTR
jgi:23S rRNA pseudouridine2605 synthase